MIALAAGAVLLVYGLARWRSRRLRQRNRALEELIEVRTGELRQAKEAAENANHAKSAFLANMSHELRTPLNAVLGYTQTMLKETTDPAQARNRERLTVVHQSGSQLLAMINEVLDLAKIEAGKISLTAQDCSLEALLEEIAAPFRLRAAEKGLEFRDERAPTLPAVVRTDAGKLRQVLLNLLGNAVKFTERGGVVLRVATADGGRVRFAVEDTGIGIDENEQVHIFEAFYQAADPAFTTQGVGLGLAISQRLVGLLGGTLGFESTLGMGSRFFFDLDLPEQSTVPALPARREEGRRPGTPVRDVECWSPTTPRRTGACCAGCWSRWASSSRRWRTAWNAWRVARRLPSPTCSCSTCGCRSSTACRCCEPCGRVRHAGSLQDRGRFRERVPRRCAAGIGRRLRRFPAQTLRRNPAAGNPGPAARVGMGAARARREAG